MKRIKEFLLNNTKVVIAFVLGIVISGTTVYAATYLYSSNQVSFDKSKVSQYGATKDDVQGAIDELYSIAKSEKCKDGYTKKSASDGYICLKDIPTTNTIAMGDDAVGKLSADGKTMIISGSGTLNVIPSDYKNTLENIIIEDGIEKIPDSFCYECSKLKEIYIAATVDTMGGSSTFRDCSNLVNITFASSNIYIDSGAMNNMFRYCSSLTSLDLSSFNTTDVADMNGMFRGCSSLTNLDLSNFNTSNILFMNFMFNGVSNGLAIKAPTAVCNKIASESRITASFTCSQ